MTMEYMERTSSPGSNGGPKAKIIAIAVKAHQELRREPFVYALNLLLDEDNVRVVVICCLSRIHNELGWSHTADLENFGGINKPRLDAEIAVQIDDMDHKLIQFRQRVENRGIQLDIFVTAGPKSDDILVQEAKELHPHWVILDSSFEGSQNQIHAELGCTVVLIRKQPKRHVILDPVNTHDTVSEEDPGLVLDNSPGSSFHPRKHRWLRSPHHSSKNSTGTRSPHGSFSSVISSKWLLGRQDSELPHSPDVSKAFTYRELYRATGGFSPVNLLGKGGFGKVYKGAIGGQVVAVKQLILGGEQGEREFRAEVDIIRRVHHRHLVSLVGYCIENRQRLLVYNYVPNGTLEEGLRGPRRSVMDWPSRMKVARGSAQGLKYLHEDCCPKIVHRDIKAANILLDDQWEPQISDFGLAKLADDKDSQVFTRVVGTFGYMAPEYAMSGKMTEKSDVYSFGVVLLELITGKPAVDYLEALVEWARPLLSRAVESGHVEDLADPKLMGVYDEEEMLKMVKIAERCVRHTAERRPNMSTVVHDLEPEDPVVMDGQGDGGDSPVRYDEGSLNRFRRTAFGASDDDAYIPSGGEFSSDSI